MKLNITLSHFEELIKQSYSLDLVFLLKLIEEGADISGLCDSSAKVCALLQSLIRKGLITEDHKITLQGKEVIAFMDTEGESKIVKRKVSGDDFDRWWKAYPGTDTFVWKGKAFEGTRSMRVKKDECKLKLKKVLEEGEYTIDELIGALEYEVTQKKENSFKSKSNKLSFMQNSLTYLNQRTFEPFIELVRAGYKVKESQPTVGGTDI